MGRFPNALMGRFPLENTLENSPLRKGALETGKSWKYLICPPPSKRRNNRKIGFWGGLSFWGGGRKYTPKVFSALKNQVPQQAKKEAWRIQKRFVFKGKEGKTHIQQRAFQVLGPLAQHWCIDLGLLRFSGGPIANIIPWTVSNATLADATLVF